MNPAEKIIVALDVPTLEDVDEIVSDIGVDVIYKIGLQLITRVGGPQSVARLHEHGARVFYDGKFADIPSVVGEASHTLALQKVHMFTVHSSASTNSIRTAVANKGSALAIGVTVLTSVTPPVGGNTASELTRLARIARNCLVDGLVCAAPDLVYLRGREFEQQFKVTPGIRPAWAETVDQKRVMTPKEAIREGADYLVIGRPITRPPHGMTTLEAYERILEEISTARSS